MNKNLRTLMGSSLVAVMLTCGASAADQIQGNAIIPAQVDPIKVDTKIKNFTEREMNTADGVALNFFHLPLEDRKLFNDDAMFYTFQTYPEQMRQKYHMIISGNPFLTERALKLLILCKNLEILLLGNCNLTNKTSEWITENNFPNLSNLNLPNNSLTDRRFANVKNWKKIKYLNLQNNLITKKILEYISEWEGLQDLCLTNTLIDEPLGNIRNDITLHSNETVLDQTKSHSNTMKDLCLQTKCNLKQLRKKTDTNELPTLKQDIKENILPFFVKNLNELKIKGQFTSKFYRQNNILSLFMRQLDMKDKIDIVKQSNLELAALGSEEIEQITCLIKLFSSMFE